MGSRFGSVQMNTWQSSALFKAPMRLWHRFHVWRAMRLYRQVLRLESDAQWLTHRADELMMKHAEDPQRRLPLGDD